MLEFQNARIHHRLGRIFPTLEDVVVLLQLPVFGELDLASYTPKCHIVNMAKELRQSTTDTANYSKRLLATHCAHKEKGIPSSKFQLLIADAP